MTTTARTARRARVGVGHAGSPRRPARGFGAQPRPEEGAAAATGSRPPGQLPQHLDPGAVTTTARTARRARVGVGHAGSPRRPARGFGAQPRPEEGAAAATGSRPPGQLPQHLDPGAVTTTARTARRARVGVGHAGSPRRPARGFGAQPRPEEGAAAATGSRPPGQLPQHLDPGAVTTTARTARRARVEVGHAGSPRRPARGFGAQPRPEEGAAAATGSRPPGQLPQHLDPGAVTTTARTARRARVGVGHAGSPRRPARGFGAQPRPEEGAAAATGSRPPGQLPQHLDPGAVTTTARTARRARVGVGHAGSPRRPARGFGAQPRPEEGAAAATGSRPPGQLPQHLDPGAVTTTARTARRAGSRYYMPPPPPRCDGSTSRSSSPPHTPISWSTRS